MTAAFDASSLLAGLYDFQWATVEHAFSRLYLDEDSTKRFLVADETGLPAVAGICATLPAGASGLAIVEVPSADDALDFEHPAGITVRWVVREHGVKPGTLALQALKEAALPVAPFHAYLVGEQALPTDGRRHLVTERGVSKDLVSFCGYWRVGAASPAPKSQRAAAEAHA